MLLLRDSLFSIPYEVCFQENADCNRYICLNCHVFYIFTSGPLYCAYFTNLQNQHLTIVYYFSYKGSFSNAFIWDIKHIGICFPTNMGGDFAS